MSDQVLFIFCALHLWLSLLSLIDVLVCIKFFTVREKLLLVDVDDKGKDLKDVQELFKRIESVVEYMSGLEKRIADHEAVSADLVTKYPDMTTSVKEKMDTLR